MTAMALEPQQHEEFLLETFHALDPPKGVRAELIDGEIVVTPPGARHDRIVGKIIRQIYQKGSADVDLAPNKGLVTPSGGGCTKNFVIPDATFAPTELDLFDEEDSWMAPEGVLLVVEVTSSRPEIDRVSKRHCYARVDIPLYLLVDRTEKQVTLFSEPEGDDYHKVTWVEFGKSLQLPEPFDFELDTFDFN